MHISKERKGEVFLLSQSLLWSFFPIVTILSLNKIPTLYTAAISTLIAAIFFIILVTIRKHWHFAKIKSAWKDILLSTAIIGILFYTVVFLGLKFTTAGNASIIAQFEIFFTLFILGFVWKKETITPKIITGALLMVIGAFFVLFQGSFHVNLGDALILLSTAIPPMGNYFAQRARAQVSSEFMMMVRSSISGLFLLMMAFFFSGTLEINEFLSSLPFLLLNGILLLGLSKAFWLEAIHKIAISKAIALNSITPAFTLVFAFFLIGEIPTRFQIIGLIPLMIGVFLLTQSRKTE